MTHPPSADRFVAEARAAAAAGDTRRALALLAACVEAHPGHAPAYRGAAALHRARGATGAAMEWLSRGLQQCAGDPAGQAGIAAELAPLLAAFAPAQPHPVLERDLAACLLAPGLDPQPLARRVGALLAVKYAGRSLDPGDPLLVALLTRCINVDPVLERRFTEHRRALLLSGTVDALAGPIATQAQAGEYVWPVAADETAALAGADPALTAMYRREPPADERARAEALPSIGGATDAVRDQYEANPYPRWTVPPAAVPRDLAAHVGALPGVAALPPVPWRVLIAGAGTGYEAIDLAQGDPSLAITALDLSRASLAYGQARAPAGIRFVQGDLLHADRLGERFDAIVSTGVLHHLADPAAGLAALAGVLAPGGVMRIALYSARARALVRQAHALIAERGYDPTIAGIRAFRAAILALPADAPLARLAESDDFWSASGCRDLAFHVREHHYDFAGIGTLVAGAGLRLVAVDAPPAARALYDGTDLARWDAVERDDPSLFAGMIAVWLQKPGTAAPART